MKILLAEDDPISRQLICDVIPDGYLVVQTEDGGRTVEQLVLAHERGVPFDLLILDLELPCIDGLNVLSVLRGLEEPRKLSGGKCTKVLIVTGRTEGEAIYGAHALACDGYLVKPIERRKLATEVERLCPRS